MPLLVLGGPGKAGHGSESGLQAGQELLGSTCKGSPCQLSLTYMWCLLACRETNMKVRQAIPVTVELGNTSQLARFDGECL